jgi:hypothetical protein
MDALDSTTDELCFPRFRPRLPQWLPAAADAEQASTDQQRAQVAGDGLDFGELRHPVSFDGSGGGFKVSRTRWG